MGHFADDVRDLPRDRYHQSFSWLVGDTGWRSFALFHCNCAVQSHMAAYIAFTIGPIDLREQSARATRVPRVEDMEQAIEGNSAGTGL